MKSFHLILLLPLVRALDVTYFFYKTSPICNGQEFLRTVKPFGQCARPSYAKQGELFSSVFGFASGIPDARVFVYAPVEGRSTGDDCVGSLARSDEQWCGTANLESSISGAKMMNLPGKTYPINSQQNSNTELESSALFSQCNVGDHYGWHDDSDMFQIRADSEEGRHYDELKSAKERLGYVIPVPCVNKSLKTFPIIIHFPRPFAKLWSPFHS